MDKKIKIGPDYFGRRIGIMLCSIALQQPHFNANQQLKSQSIIRHFGWPLPARHYQICRLQQPINSGKKSRLTTRAAQRGPGLGAGA